MDVPVPGEPTPPIEFHFPLPCCGCCVSSSRRHLCRSSASACDNCQAKRIQNYYNRIFINIYIIIKIKISNLSFVPFVRPVYPRKCGPPHDYFSTLHDLCLYSLADCHHFCNLVFPSYCDSPYYSLLSQMTFKIISLRNTRALLCLFSSRSLLQT